MAVSTRNGVEIFYEIAGSGPPLVLIHALPFDHHLWLYQVEHYSSRFTTLAMDLRGFGRSGKPHAPFTLRNMGEDVMGVLRDNGLAGPAIVMGCSIGSKIALMLACHYPETFAAAILVGGNSGPQNQFDHRIRGYRDHAAAGTLADYHRGHLRYGVTKDFADSDLGHMLIEDFVARGRELDTESVARVFEALTVSDLTPELPDYRTPTLIVNGEHDSALKGGTLTASLIPHSEHVILAGAGHCCFLEKPWAFHEKVDGFLARHGLEGA